MSMISINERLFRRRTENFIENGKPRSTVPSICEIGDSSNNHRKYQHSEMSQHINEQARNSVFRDRSKP